MNHIDYSGVRGLLTLYAQIFAPSLSVVENDLLNEMTTKLSHLDELSREIVDLLSNLDALHYPGFIPDGEGYDILNYRGLSLRLKRADPNVPIKRAQSSVGYTLGQTTDSTRDPELRSLERKLERATISYYQFAYRVTRVTRGLPHLTSFECRPVTIVRNKLIEHPEKKDSEVTYESFVYSMSDGPCVKGLRRGGQTKHPDAGFRKNSEAFVSNLTKTLRQAIA